MCKKILRTVVAFVLVASMLVVPALAESATVTGSGVNLRAGPGVNYRVVDCLDLGAVVTVTDRSNSSWYAVEYNSARGFISSSYLRVTEESNTAEIQQPTENSGYINAMYVRFRSGPGSDYSILGAFNKGKTVAITGISGEWTACTIDGQAGYVYSSYISSGAPSQETDNSGSYDEYGGSFTQPTTPTASPTETPVQTPALPTATPIVTAAPPQNSSIPSSATPEPTVAPTPEASPTATPLPTATPTPTPTATPAPTPEVKPSEPVSGYINGDYVRFRTGPSTSHSIIESYNKGKTVTVTGVSGDWTACTIDGQAGYVFSQYIVKQEASDSSTPTPETSPTATPAPTPTKSADGYINGNNVRMRGGPSMNAEVLGELFFGNAVTITGVSGDWTAVTYKGTAGYVYSSYVKEGVYNYSDSTSSSTGSAEGQEIAQFALQYVGYNYSWGGSSPSTGFDCSGFVYYVYQHFGYTLNRVAADQAMNGVHVDQLEPGDILCFYSGSSYIGHSGIYIGDGKFIHSANSATGVIVTELSGYYTTRGYEARRIVGA